MNWFRKNKKENVTTGDFNTSVLKRGIVPTAIYSRTDAIGFAVKERGIIFGNLKRGKSLKL